MATFANRRFTVFLVTTVFLLWFSGLIQREVRVFHPAEMGQQVDFAVYYTSGLVARSDSDKRLYSLPKLENPKDGSTVIRANPQLMRPDPQSTYAQFDQISKSNLQYLYPPPFAGLMIPLTFLPYSLARIVWHVALTGFLLSGIFAAFSVFVKPVVERCFFAVMAVALLEFTLPMQDLLLVGNIGSVLLLLCSIGVSTMNRVPIVSAFAFALATAFKLTPIAVLPVMLIHRQWKWCIAYTASLACIFATSISILGFANHREFFFTLIPEMSHGVPVATNASFLSVIYSVISGTVISSADYPDNLDASILETSSAVFKILVFSSYAFGLAFLAWMRNSTKLGLVVSVTVILLWTLPFSPVSWRHGYVLAFLPIVCAWAIAYGEQWTNVRLGLLTASTVSILSILPSYMSAATESLIVDLFAMAILPVGALLLIVLYLEFYARMPTVASDDGIWKLRGNFGSD